MLIKTIKPMNFQYFLLSVRTFYKKYYVNKLVGLSILKIKSFIKKKSKQN